MLWNVLKLSGSELHQDLLGSSKPFTWRMGWLGRKQSIWGLHDITKLLKLSVICFGFLLMTDCIFQHNKNVLLSMWFWYLFHWEVGSHSSLLESRWTYDCGKSDATWLSWPHHKSSREVLLGFLGLTFGALRNHISHWLSSSCRAVRKPKPGIFMLFWKKINTGNLLLIQSLGSTLISSLPSKPFLLCLKSCFLYAHFSMV